VEILGYQPDEVVREYVANACAFVFAAQEDFGIAPVEAQACGTPVIAFGKGGALETVVDGETGVFFHDQSVASVVDAVRRFEEIGDQFDAKTIRMNAERFSEERFRQEFGTFVREAWERKERDMRGEMNIYGVTGGPTRTLGRKSDSDRVSC
jgi:glycosyltransferase involved in cell wall biosynthesis